MPEIANLVTMKGNPVTLVGDELEIGQSAPDCTLVANDLSEVKLSSFKGKNVILSVVPSLDTAVCDIQTKRFNDEAKNLGNQTIVLTISMDLPFAQKRWCGTALGDNPNLQTLSDHRSAEFGEKYGVLVKGLRLLARAIFIVDANGSLSYKQIVNEITNEPNYEDALNALKNL